MFFPRTEFMAFEPICRPRLANVLTSPLPVWPIPRNFLYFFLILLALSCAGVLARANLTLFFCFVLVRRWFRWLIFRDRGTALLPGKYFLLILSYLDTKDVPLGKFTHSRTALLPYTILSFIFVFLLFFFDCKFFFKKMGFAISPRNGVAAEAITPIGNLFPLCFLYLLFLPPIY